MQNSSLSSGNLLQHSKFLHSKQWKSTRLYLPILQDVSVEAIFINECLLTMSCNTASWPRWHCSISLRVVQGVMEDIEQRALWLFSLFLQWLSTCLEDCSGKCDSLSKSPSTLLLLCLPPTPPQFLCLFFLCNVKQIQNIRLRYFYFDEINKLQSSLPSQHHPHPQPCSIAVRTPCIETAEAIGHIDEAQIKKNKQQPK